MIRFHYVLEVDGEEVGSSRDRDPLEVRIGEGQVVIGVEEALAGMEPGEKRVVVVPPERGYGEHDDEGVQPVPLAAFDSQAAALELGQMVEGELNDTPFVARVAEIRSDEVVLDFNHPLAGKVLRFTLERVD